jgi:hypothetical protein
MKLIIAALIFFLILSCCRSKSEHAEDYAVQENSTANSGIGN